jgi:hypothetical protein
MSLPAPLAGTTITGWPALLIILVVLIVFIAGIVAIVRLVGRGAKKVLDD